MLAPYAYYRCTRRLSRCFGKPRQRLTRPLLLSTVYRAECTPAEAVFCDEGLTCQSGTAGYTCGEILAAAVVPTVSMPAGKAPLPISLFPISQFEVVEESGLQIKCASVVEPICMPATCLKKVDPCLCNPFIIYPEWCTVSKSSCRRQTDGRA